MPHFGEGSKQQLATCVPEINEICNEAIEIVDFKVLEGRRSWQRQRGLLRDKKTKLGPGESKHNSPPNEDGNEDPDFLSRAVDLVPYPVDWKDTKRFTYLAGIIIAVAHKLGYTVRWGGNWDMDQVIIDDQNFDDLPHFELLEKIIDEEPQMDGEPIDEVTDGPDDAEPTGGLHRDVV